MKENRKRLKSVAYNLGNSFISLMNDPIDEILFSEARRLNVTRITIDFLTGEINPKGIDNKDLIFSVGCYRERLPQMVEMNGCSMEYVKSVVMNVFLRKEDLQNPDIELYRANLTVKTIITDDKSNKYIGTCNNGRGL